MSIRNVRNMRYNLRSNFGNSGPVLTKPIFNKQIRITKTIKTKNVQKYSWNILNTYRNANDNNEINNITNETIRKELVSGTEIKNYLHKDTILDVLKYHPNLLNIETTESKRTFNIIYNNEINNLTLPNVEILINNTVSDSIPIQKGNEYEIAIYNKLKSDYPNDVICIADDLFKIKLNDYVKTFEAMKQGIPIIYQGILYNYTNLTFGIADFIVRSDFVNALFDIPPLSDEEMYIPAPKLNANYHYVIIDTKWSTIPLCANSRLILNSGRFPSYKGQLAIYNAALGLLQGYVPNKAYIMAKSWKYIERGIRINGHNSFDRLGIIDYKNFDNKYIKLTADAIQWIRNVRYNGNNWSLDPPSRPELWPNMKNQYDAPYHKIKMSLAEKYSELTLLYRVGVKNRQIAHSKNIMSFIDPRCNAKVLGINGPKIGPIVDRIIQVNSPLCTNIILPLLIKNNAFGWQNNNKFEMSIDVETIEECIINNEININNSKCETGVIFMLGIGYYETNEWKYKVFRMDRYSLENEKIIINEFINFIEFKVNEYMVNYNIYDRSQCYPILYHWSHAERSFLNNANRRHNYIWSNWLNMVNLLDFCKVWQDEPIAIKGATNYRLKNIGLAMFRHGLINTKWAEDGPSDGLMAMQNAVLYYNFMKKYDESSDEIKELIRDRYDMNISEYQKIIEYNENDCKVLYDIVNYSRENMIQKIE